MTSISIELLDLLRSLHIHTLKDEEVLLVKDPKRNLERKDGISQVHYLAEECACMRVSWVLSVFCGV